MSDRNRREFLGDVGKGMLVASVGTGLASELGINPALAVAREREVNFGALEPLAARMQDTSADAMQREMAKMVREGVDLKKLVSAGALANARTFGGEHYIGYHAFMAMAPAYHMSKLLPKDKAALPVLKVLYRSAKQMELVGGRKNEVFHDHPEGTEGSSAEIYADMRAVEMNKAERKLSGVVARSAKEAFEDLQPLVQDAPEVHRVVLLYRAWETLGLTGMEHAKTTLRQSLRYCVNVEKQIVAKKYATPSRDVMPKIIDRYGLESARFGSLRAGDAWLQRTAKLLIESSPTQAAEVVAEAIKDGFSVDSIGELLTLSSNQLVLRDKGRTQAYPGKPIGSVHGDSMGVHASDSMNAWWNMAKISSPRNAAVGLVVGGLHVAQGIWNLGSEVYPLVKDAEEVRSMDKSRLLAEVDDAVRYNNQGRAAAACQRYVAEGLPARPMFDLLLKFAISEDGTLHAEKYYRTVFEEYHRARPAFRAGHLAALARVTASEFGVRAEGYEDACGLLGVQA